jgi:hypothetical protein
VLALERLGQDFRAAPGPVKVGVIALALSLFDDLTLHVASGSLFEPISHVHAFTPDEFAAHLAAFASMVLIVSGVVVDGVRRTRARRTPTARDQEGVA